MDPMIKQYLQLYHDLEHAHAVAEHAGDHNMAKGCLEEMKAAEVYFAKYFNLRDLKWPDNEEPENV